MNVILDLDNTIISTQSTKSKVKYYNYLIYDKTEVIYFRPHLQEFLDYLFDNFNVSVFTHADKDYAMFIVDNIILGRKERKLDFVFYRYHVNMGMRLYNGYKDLRLLWDEFKMYGFYPSNTVIIDDNVLVQQTNPYNTIRVVPFEANNEKDDELLRVIKVLQYLKQKEVKSNIPILYDK